MTETNGSKATIREVYQELGNLERRQTRDREEMERRIIDSIAEGFAGVRKDSGDYRDKCDVRLKCLEDDLVGLKVADRKWGGLAALVAAAVTALGIALKR